VDHNLFHFENLEIDPAQFCYIGTMSEWQNPSILLEAVLIARTELPAIKIIMSGTGSLHNELAKISKEHNLPIHFTGLINPDEVREILNRSIASIVTFDPKSGYSVSMPTKVLTSLACGTPVISAGLLKDSIHPWVIDNQLCVDFDPISLAQKLIHVSRYSDKYANRNFRKDISKSLEQDYSPPRYESVINDISKWILKSET
jgi:glycosyltransferase involved in cell wall biosynthesis